LGHRAIKKGDFEMEKLSFTFDSDRGVEVVLGALEGSDFQVLTDIRSALRNGGADTLEQMRGKFSDHAFFLDVLAHFISNYCVTEVKEIGWVEGKGYAFSFKI